MQNYSSKNKRLNKLKKLFQFEILWIIGQFNVLTIIRLIQCNRNYILLKIFNNF